MEQPMKPSYTYKAVLKRVVDGDTVVADIDLGFDTWIHDQYIRFFDYDAPETRTKDLGEKERGLKAKEFLSSLLAPGDDVLLHSMEFRRGKYGRILGDIETPQCPSVILRMKEHGHEK